MVQHFFKKIKSTNPRFFPVYNECISQKKCEQEDAMGRFLNPGNEAFSEVIHSEIYVDKTPLLEYTNKVISTTSKFICSSRPRRFGKSITAEMLSAYYSKGCDSRALFADYAICKASSFEKSSESVRCHSF